MAFDSEKGSGTPRRYTEGPAVDSTPSPKTLYLIGGAMGVGKTAACQILKKELPDSVFLDGDWCWDADPFQVTEETRRIVLDNICYLLNQFLRCSAYQNVIFCWVLHQQGILDEILSRLTLQNVKVWPVSLLCGEECLRRRVRKDVAAGLRKSEEIERSVGYLPLYEKLNTVKIDVSQLSPEQTAQCIRHLRTPPKAGSSGRSNVMQH